MRLVTNGNQLKNFRPNESIIYMAKKRIIPELIIKDYIKDLSGQIKVDGAFIFGSYATGKVREDSDLDYNYFPRF